MLTKTREWRHIFLLGLVSWFCFSLFALIVFVDETAESETVTAGICRTSRESNAVPKAADEEAKRFCFVTFELLVHVLPLLMAAELNETLQHSNGVVSKRHLEGGEQSETVRSFIHSTTTWDTSCPTTRVSWTLTLSLVESLSFKISAMNLVTTTLVVINQNCSVRISYSLLIK